MVVGHLLATATSARRERFKSDTKTHVGSRMRTLARSERRPKSNKKLQPPTKGRVVRRIAVEHKRPMGPPTHSTRVRMECPPPPRARAGVGGTPRGRSSTCEQRDTSPTLTHQKYLSLAVGVSRAGPPPLTFV